MPDHKSDSFWMELALSLAKSAASMGEVPVGAIIVKDNELISTGINLKEKNQLVTGHAEILAINRASKNLCSWRLTNCHLYVTLEPCIMCAGAIYQSRIAKVIYGAKDPKGGAFGSLYSLQNDNRLNHIVEVSQGILENRCSEELKSFFRARRK